MKILIDTDMMCHFITTPVSSANELAAGIVLSIKAVTKLINLNDSFTDEEALSLLLVLVESIKNNRCIDANDASIQKIFKENFEGENDYDERRNNPDGKNAI